MKIWRNSHPSLLKPHKIDTVILRVTEKKKEKKRDIWSSITKYVENKEGTEVFGWIFEQCTHTNVGECKGKNQQMVTKPLHPLIHTPNYWKNTDSQSTGCLVRLGGKIGDSVNIYWVFIELQLDRIALLVLLILLIAQYAAFIHLFLLTILSSADI